MNTTLTPNKPNTISRDERMNQQPAGPRCMIWVDGVGGFLTCFSPTVRIGQAITGAGMEIPVIGDLSRHHATIERQGEAYLITPEGPTWVEQREIVAPRVLSDGDEIRLGETFEMRFRQPHALSTTARLDVLSRHRTQPSADSILLMAGSCILGPSASDHVVCRQWEREVVLVRQGQKLSCHLGGTFEVDGKTAQQRAAVTLDSRIQGDDFCLSLERLD